MYRLLYLAIIFISLSTFGISKVRIISAAYNRPDLIELQYRCLKQFVVEEFEQVMFNDAENPVFATQIEEECAKYGIRHIRVPQDTVHQNNQVGAPGWEKPFSFRDERGNSGHYRVNFREGEMLQFAFEQVGFEHDDIVVGMDLDCFPIRPVSFKEILGNSLIAGIMWEMPPNISPYPMPIFMVFDMPKLPHKKAINFNSGFVGSKWFDLCALIQFYVYCHDIEIKDYYKLGHVHCSRLGANYTIEELINMGYEESTAQFVKNYYEQLFVKRKYQADANIYYDHQSIDPSKSRIIDQGQILEKHFFHYNQCTNWMGAYNAKFMKVKNRLVREFVYSITTP